MAIRSFLAFELPPEIRKTIKDVSGEIRRSELNLRWVKVDNIHLTVVFMGDIRAEDVQAIGAEIEGVCLGFEPFEISLKGLSVFPNTQRPRVLWLGLEMDTERIRSLKNSLEERLSAFGIKEEKRSFTPHLTLGRFNKPGRCDSIISELISRYKDLKSPEFRTEEMVMYKSELKSGGAKYTKLKICPLKGIIS
jgi:RNA 2',3'-cyclic 3'-phosphodiesterase